MARSGPDNPVVSMERERERVIEALSQHFAHDNLSLDELDRRMEQVYRARTVSALRELTKDLPTESGAVAPRPAAPVPQAFAPDEGRLVSIMGSMKRRGLWQPPRQLNVFTIMSETLLDLTEAALARGVTEIELRAVMASIKIIVPPNVRVVVEPSAFMAEVNDQTIDPPPVGSGAPVVRITGFVFMSELKVVIRRRERLDDV